MELGDASWSPARWGMPSSSKALMDATKNPAEKLQAKGKTVNFKELLRMVPDGGTTNIRNAEQALDTVAETGAPLRGAVQLVQRIQQGRGRRHLVRARGDLPARLLRRHLDQLDICTQGEGGRDRKRSVCVHHGPSRTPRSAVHPKAMPVILTTPDEVETRMTAPSQEAMKLQLPLPDGALADRRVRREGRSRRASGATDEEERRAKSFTSTFRSNPK
jgi:hypothetical protein